MNRKDKLKVRALFDQLVASLNAARDGDRWSISTAAGHYRFNLSDGLTAPFRSGAPWIYGSFQESRRAGELFQANPYSGKFNFHDVNPETFAIRVESQLRHFAGTSVVDAA